MELAESFVEELFHDAEHTGYASLCVRGHREVYPLRSKQFRDLLTNAVYRSERRTPGAQAVQEALAVLDGTAVCEGPRRDVHVRIASADGSFYLDLGDDNWTVIRISRDGWTLDPDPPVRFIRPKGVTSLPMPVRGGSVRELRGLVNLADDDDLLLLLGWLVGALNPDIPVAVCTSPASRARRSRGPPASSARW